MDPSTAKLRVLPLMVFAMYPVLSRTTQVQQRGLMRVTWPLASPMTGIACLLALTCWLPISPPLRLSLRLLHVARQRYEIPLAFRSWLTSLVLSGACEGCRVWSVL